MGDGRVGPILFVLFVFPAPNSQRLKKPGGKASSFLPPGLSVHLRTEMVVLRESPTSEA